MTDPENSKETCKKNLHEKCLAFFQDDLYKSCLERMQDNVASYLEELRYLWIPAFTAVLSLIFFAGIDQTLEVYRVFALNPSVLFFTISFSFTFIFLLSLSIWYSSRRLLIRYSIDEVPHLKARKRLYRTNARKYLPRVLGSLPLLALGLGLFRTTIIPESYWFLLFCAFVFVFALAVWASLCHFSIFLLLFAFASCFGVALAYNLPGLPDNPLTIFNWNFGNFKYESLYLFYLWLGIVIAVLLSYSYFYFVLRRTRVPNNPNNEEIASEDADTSRTKAPQSIGGSSIYNLKNLPSNLKNLSSDKNLFRESFLVGLSFFSTLVLSICSFPLITDDTSHLKILVAFLISISWCVCIVFIMPILTSNRNENRSWTYILTGCLFFILLLVAFKIIPPLADRIGSVSIVALFLIVFVLWSSVIFYLGYSNKIPIIAILLIIAIASSFFDWNDNHPLRELAQKDKASQTQEDKAPQTFSGLEESFKSWIESRSNEIEKFSTVHKYPIYIVSAQGGGIYAAYHAALTLSRLHDSYPTFTKNVFAISGVSGGSLGAAVFSSLVETKKADETLHHDLGAIEQKAHEVLDHDFLAPLLAAGLFPDFVQRFIPHPFNFVDRARGLEYAFEQSWDHAQDKWDESNKNQKDPYDPQKDNPLRNSYYEHWKPKGTAPALVLNTTVVETGDRLVLSPFKIDLPTLKDIRTVACKKDKKDLDFPLSTAAILSARFTLVTPVGWFDRCDNRKDGEVEAKNPSQKARLADGGYFENSGISTAFEIGKRLEEILKKDIEGRKIKVIYLAITDQSPPEIPKAGGFNEEMSPIFASLSTREARGRSAVAQVEYLVDGANADPNSTNDLSFQEKYAKHRFRQFYLHDVDLVDGKAFSKFKPPLGWFLSKYSQDFIKKQIGYKNEENCPDDLTKGSHNTCVFRSIKEELDLAISLSK